MRFRSVAKVRYEKFLITFASSLLCRVVKFDSPNVEVFEKLSYLWIIVQRQNKLALDIVETFCELLEIVVREVEPIQTAVSIRWIDVKQCS